MQNIRILSGIHKKHRLDFLPQKELRPTTHSTRHCVFNIINHRFYPQGIGKSNPLEGFKILDLFAGIGSYGFEAISLGAHHVTFVESSMAITKYLYEFAQKLKCPNKVKILCNKLPQWHKPKEEVFDLIFMDPPYDFSPREVENIINDCASILSPHGLMILEFPLGGNVPSLKKVLERKSRNTLVTFFNHGEI